MKLAHITSQHIMHTRRTKDKAKYIYLSSLDAVMFRALAILVVWHAAMGGDLYRYFRVVPVLAHALITWDRPS